MTRALRGCLACFGLLFPIGLVPTPSVATASEATAKKTVKEASNDMLLEVLEALRKREFSAFSLAIEEDDPNLTFEGGTVVLSLTKSYGEPSEVAVSSTGKLFLVSKGRMPEVLGFVDGTRAFTRVTSETKLHVRLTLKRLALLLNAGNLSKAGRGAKASSSKEGITFTFPVPKDTLPAVDMEDFQVVAAPEKNRDELTEVEASIDLSSSGELKQIRFRVVATDVRKAMAKSGNAMQGDENQKILERAKQDESMRHTVKFVLSPKDKCSKRMTAWIEEIEMLVPPKK